MAKAEVSTAMRTTAECTLNLDGDEVTMEFDEIGVVPFKDVFSRFNGEHVKITMAVTNDGYENTDVDSDEDVD